MIKAPRLLDNSLNEVRRINPTSISLTLNLTPLSTATMKLPYGEKVPERSWVELYSSTGSVGIFRAREPINGYGDNETSIELEHGVTEIGDWMVTGTIQKTEGIGAALAELFAYYTAHSSSSTLMWQLDTTGVAAFTDSVTVDVDYDNLLEAIIGVVKQTPYMLTYDFGTSPWTLGLAQVGQTMSEGRLSRNVLSATIQKNDTDLCTRIFYCYQEKQNKQQVDVWNHYDADTISTYGIVEKKLSETQLTQAEAESKAAEYLEIHKHPKLSITINGYDLSSVTGESLDEVMLGKKYRLTIPDEEVIVEEIAKTIQYPDLVENEYNITVSLAQEDDYLIDALNSTKALSKSASSTKKKVDHLEYEFTDEDGRFESYLFMNSEALRTEFTDTVSGLRSQLEITASHLETVFETVSGFSSTIEQTASYIRTEVSNLQSDVRSLVTQTADMVRTEVGSAVSGLAQSVIEQTATYIRQEVSNAASSISASVIEQTSDYVRTEVASVVSELAWSAIEQTMTGIIQEVGRKSKIYVQWSDPNDGENELLNGDLWIKTTSLRTWNDVGGMKWSDVAAYKWRDYYGSEMYVWKNGKWEKVNDEAAIVESQVNVEQDNEHWAVLAKAVDLQGQEYRSNLSVTAQKISSDVSTAKSQLYSSIEQTATQINMKVADVQTGLSSQITQTASQIRSEVTSAASGLQSSITQNADKIRLVVKQENGQNVVNAASIVLGINNQDKTSSSYVDIKADKIDLTGYVTASQFNATNAEIDNLKAGNTAFTLMKAGSVQTGTLRVNGKLYTLVEKNIPGVGWIHYLGY